MTSSKQLAANRLNAKKSTGPKSREGKFRSSLNAWKHGITAEQVVIAGEDPRDFEELRQGLTHEWNPKGPTESALAERLAILLWRLSRVPLFEAAILKAHRDQNPRSSQREEDEWRNALASRFGSVNAPAPAKEVIELAQRMREERKTRAENNPKSDNRDTGAALIRDAEKNDALGKVLRYETTLTNGLARTMSMLISLQTARKAREEASREIAVEATPPASP